MNNIIKTFLCLLIVNIWTISVWGQHQTESKIQGLMPEKKNFISKQVGITIQEGQQFWPVYNEYLDKKNLLHVEKIKITCFYKYNNKGMTENDVTVTMNKYLKIIRAQSLLEEIYNKRFRKLLSQAKVMQIYVAETDFNNMKSMNNSDKETSMQ